MYSVGAPLWYALSGIKKGAGDFSPTPYQHHADLNDILPAERRPRLPVNDGTGYHVIPPPSMRPTMIMIPKKTAPARTSQMVRCRS